VSINLHFILHNKYKHTKGSSASAKYVKPAVSINKMYLQTASSNPRGPQGVSGPHIGEGVAWRFKFVCHKYVCILYLQSY
jgi:hypothetical protein